MLFTLLLFLFSFSFATISFIFDPRLTTSAFYENKEKSFIEGDLLIPLLQSDHFILFGNVRGLNRKKSEFEWSAGLGSRFLTHQNQNLWGLFFFFDRKLTNADNFFNQFSFGFESRFNHVALTTNAYFPIGKKRKRASQFDQSKLVTSPVPTLENIIFVEGKEIALYGFDFEAGFKLIRPIYLYIGGFYFNGDQTQALYGPRVRTELLFETKQKGFIPLSRWSLEGLVTYDHIRKTKVYAGLRFSFDLGDARQNKKRKGLQKWMTGLVRRDYDVVIQGNNKTPFQTLHNPNGPVVVKKAATLAEFNEGLVHADVIAVTEDLILENTKTLKPYQTVTSDTFLFGNSQLIHLGPGQKQLTSALPEMFTLTQNNQLRDLTLMVNEGDFLFKSIIDIENCQIHNIQTNAKVFLQLEDGSQNSTLTVKNSSFTLDAPGTHILFDLLVKNNSQLTTYFEHNQLRSNADTTTLLKQKIENEGAFNVLGILSNHFIIQNGGSNIALLNEIDTSLSNGIAQMNTNCIEHNQFHFYGNGSAQAIVMANNHTTLSGSLTSTLAIGQMNNNHIHYHDLTFGDAIVFQNEATHINHQNLLCNHFHSNHIFFASTHPSSKTILLSNSGISNQSIVIGTQDGLGGFYLNETRFEDMPNKVGLIQINNNTPSTVHIFINMNNHTLSKANFNSEVILTGNNQENITLEK
jgi:hypothetical protein